LSYNIFIDILAGTSKIESTLQIDKLTKARLASHPSLLDLALRALIFISKANVNYVMKLIQALPGMPNPVTEPEVINILNKKLNLQIATIDEQGYPTIQPVWFLYNKDSGKIYSGTRNTTKKIENMKRNPDKVYFSIDDENFPYKGVKGRAEARIIEESKNVLPIIEKINVKYLGTNDHPLAQMLIDSARKGEQFLIELTPKFFSAWDFGKAM
jgi:general stress protein 26